MSPIHRGLLASLILTLGHAVSFVWDFLVRGEYRSTTLARLIGGAFAPCLGLFTAVALALGGTLLFPNFATASGFAIVVILLKIAIDVRVYRRERVQLRAGPPPIPRGTAADKPRVTAGL